MYPAPIAEPLTWIPHAVNASAMSQVWLFDARMGPLNDSMVHIGFNNPELFRVLINGRGKRPQAAVVSVTRAFDFPPLNGSVNPADGQLYLAGFQVLGWGTTATRSGRTRPRALHRRANDGAARSRADGQGRAAAIRRAARAGEGRRSQQLRAHDVALQAHVSVRIRAVQGGRHTGRRLARPEQRVSSRRMAERCSSAARA